MKPIQIDIDHESITIAWNSKNNSKFYELSMKTITNEASNDSTSNSTSNSEFVVLSNKLQNCFARKKNLKSTCSYVFRVRSSLDNDNDNWSEYSDISDEFSPLNSSITQPAAPVLVSADISSITISWDQIINCIGYKLQYRSIDDKNDTNSNSNSNSIEWKTIGSVLTNTNAKKKNLIPNTTYHFRICPVFDIELYTTTYTYSRSSEPLHVHVVTFPPNLVSLLPKQLLQKPPTSSTAIMTDMQTLLSNKIIAIYFSAHWCGPCRKFTPMLTSIYQEAKRLNYPFEVVFCSADHSESECNSYYNDHMAWSCIPYLDDSSENLQSTFKVNGIPRLVVLNGTTGAVIANNALDGGSVTIENVKQWVKSIC